MQIRQVAVPFALSLVMLLSISLSPAPVAAALTEGAAAANWSMAGNGQIDLNQASKEELMTLPGVDEAVAQKIINSRPYTSKADLRERKVVSPSTFYKILNRVKISIVNEKKPQPKKPEQSNGTKKGTSTQQ